MLSEIQRNHIRILLSESFLFNDLLKDELNEIAEFTTIRTVKPREIIIRKYDPGNEMFIIVSGKVSLSTVTEDGKELTFAILGDGEIFGEISLFDNMERTATVTAVESTELLILEQQRFIPYIKENGNIAVKLLSAMAQRLRYTDQLFEDTMFRQLPNRLAKKILLLADNFGQNTREGVRITIKLSQNEIGKMSGASRESVNKQMRVWEDEGLVRIDKGYITIRKKEELEFLVD
jgi:CRP/FNR family cyclic AMP-dependent transcriptional regulator